MWPVAATGCICVFVFVFVKLWLFGLLVWGISSLMRPVGANRCLIWENSYLERRPLDFCLPASIHREYLQIPNCNVGIKDFSLLGNICTNPSLTIQRLIVHCIRFGRRLGHQIAPACYLLVYNIVVRFPCGLLTLHRPSVCPDILGSRPRHRWLQRPLSAARSANLQPGSILPLVRCILCMFEWVIVKLTWVTSHPFYFPHQWSVNFV